MQNTVREVKGWAARREDKWQDDPVEEEDGESKQWTGITITTDAAWTQNGAALAGVASRDGEQSLWWAKEVATHTPPKESGNRSTSAIQRGWTGVQLSSDSLQSIRNITYNI